MRIVGGKLKGLKINPPGNLPVRPTTDMAKEALFNILNQRFDYENSRIMDLFSGTGNISIEFASRGVPDITSVDISFKCVQFLKDTIKAQRLNGFRVIKADAFKFLLQEMEPFDLIFADAPFDHPKLSTIPQLIFDRGLLRRAGLLIVEHPSTLILETHPMFTEQRRYGYSSFSFFENLI